MTTYQIECKLCFKQIGHNHIKRHLRTIHSKDDKEYYNEFYGIDNKCKQCGKGTDFVSINSGYKKTCGMSCSGKYSWDNDTTNRKELFSNFLKERYLNGNPMEGGGRKEVKI